MVEVVNNIQIVDERVDGNTETDFVEYGGMKIPREGRETVYGSQDVNFGGVEIPEIKTRIWSEGDTVKFDPPLDPSKGDIPF